MKKVSGMGLFLILVTLVVLAVVSCGQKAGEEGVSQEEYDAIKNQLDAAQVKIALLESATGQSTVIPGEQALKDEIAALKTDIENLNRDIKELNDKNDVLTQDKAAWEKRYAELEIQYEKLQQTLAELTKPEIITEELVENEIFRLINEERIKAGVPELLLGKYLDTQAKQNSRRMAESGKFEYDPAVFYQEIFWAAAYDSLDAIGRAALLTWKANQYNFEHGALLPNNVYGAVGAYESGEIIYITFMAAPFQ